jgi:hypothetical protein
MTIAPSSANRKAVALPNPEPAPVTTATFSVSIPIIPTSLLCLYQNHLNRNFRVQIDVYGIKVFDENGNNCLINDHWGEGR